MASTQWKITLLVEFGIGTDTASPSTASAQRWIFNKYSRCAVTCFPTVPSAKFLSWNWWSVSRCLNDQSYTRVEIMKQAGRRGKDDGLLIVEFSSQRKAGSSCSCWGRTLKSIFTRRDREECKNHSTSSPPSTSVASFNIDNDRRPVHGDLLLSRSFPMSKWDPIDRSLR